MNTSVSSTGTGRVGPRCGALRGKVDGRSKEARYFKILVASIFDHLGHEPTEAERSLAERIAGLLMQLDVITAKIVRGEKTDVDEHCDLGMAVHKAMSALGILPLKIKRDLPSLRDEMGV